MPPHPKMSLNSYQYAKNRPGTIVVTPAGAVLI